MNQTPYGGGWETSAISGKSAIYSYYVVLKMLKRYNWGIRGNYETKQALKAVKNDKIDGFNSLNIG